jgi:hypothetical protein
MPPAKKRARASPPDDKGGIEAPPPGQGMLYRPGGGVPYATGDAQDGPIMGTGAGGRFTLEDLTKALRCDYIQLLPCTHGRLSGCFLVVDEEGALKADRVPASLPAELVEQCGGAQLYGHVLLVHESSIE